MYMRSGGNVATELGRITMRHFIINIERAVERRARMVDAFTRQYLDFEIIEGYDWRNLTEEHLLGVDYEVRARQGRRTVRLGSVGCWLGHKKAMRRLVESHERLAAVFEDDIDITNDLGPVLAEIESTSIKFDIVFLHRNKPEYRFMPIWRLSPTHKFGIVKYQDWGTQGYVITRDAAKRFLRDNPLMIHRIDHTLHSYWENNMITYTLNPPVVSHAHHEIGSILQESPSPRRVRTLSSTLQRIRILVDEEWRRRRSFRKRLNNRC